MHNYFMVYFKLVLTTLVLITCLIGDNFVENSVSHPLLRALCDNASHAIIGALSGIAFVSQLYDKITNVEGWILIMTSFVLSSLIDLDHFIEARSLNLEDATSLLHRPFLHCSTIPIILFVIYFIFSVFFVNYYKTSLFIGIILIAFITHHTRDSIRRGYWLCPFGHTPRLPHLWYIIITVTAPYFIYFILSICHSNFIQNTVLGNNIPNTKLTVDIPRSHYRYSIV